MKEETREELEHYLRGALRRFPDDAELAMRLGAVLALDAPAEAARWIVKAADREPDDPVMQTRAAMHLRAIGDIEAAKRHAQQALAMAREDPDQFSTPAHLALVMGQLAWSEGKLDYAETALRGAFALEPGAFFGCPLADFLVEQDRRQEALGVVTEALRAEPNAPQLHALMSRLRAGPT